MSLLFRDTVSIERPTVAYSDTREATENLAAVATGIRGSVQPRSGSYRQREYGRPHEGAFVGYVPAGTDVREGDHLIRGSDRWRVTFVAPYPAHLELDLARIPAP